MHELVERPPEVVVQQAQGGDEADQDEAHPAHGQDGRDDVDVTHRDLQGGVIHGQQRSEPPARGKRRR